MKRFLLFCMVMMILPVSLKSQEDNKALKYFEDAVEAMGGNAFLEVKDMASSGNYFMFDRFGASSPLFKFKDYTKLPDKSRYELGNNKNELEITIFNLETNEGWIKEGQKDAREATPEEMNDFRNVAKHSLDIIFRTRYKDPNNKIFYLGPGQGRDLNLDMVKLIDPDNDEVTVYFNRMTKLPAKIEFRQKDENGVRQRIVQEFSQWHWIQGVQTTLRTDGYINGRQTYQSHTIEITFNNDFEDSLFTKPVEKK